MCLVKGALRYCFATLTVSNVYWYCVLPQNLVQFRIINWLLSCLFGVLICNIQPNGNTSKDRNTNNCNDSLDSGGKSSLGKVDVRHNHLLDDGRYSDIRVGECSERVLPNLCIYIFIYIKWRAAAYIITYCKNMKYTRN